MVDVCLFCLLKRHSVTQLDLCSPVDRNCPALQLLYANHRRRATGHNVLCSDWGSVIRLGAIWPDSRRWFNSRRETEGRGGGARVVSGVILSNQSKEATWHRCGRAHVRWAGGHNNTQQKTQQKHNKPTLDYLDGDTIHECHEQNLLPRRVDQHTYREKAGAHAPIPSSQSPSRLHSNS